MNNDILPNAFNFLSMSEDELESELHKDKYTKDALHIMIKQLVKWALRYAEAANTADEKVRTYKMILRYIRSEIPTDIN
jgi:hypothetical protein